jgi:hypothetical protein
MSLVFIQALKNFARLDELLDGDPLTGCQV